MKAILIFGQPASGKTTLADGIVNELKKNNDNSFVRIDGDKWRQVTNNTNYSRDGRVINLKGAFDMAIYLYNDGYIPILSFVTPYEELRKYLREKIDLIEVYLEYTEDRGRNNFFAKDFEPPTNDCLIINTSELTLEESIKKIINKI